MPTSETPAPFSPAPPRNETKVFLFALVIAFVVSAAAHLQEIRHWASDPSLIINKEFIQGTHDTYHWLAGAKGVGEAVGTPLALLAKWFSEFTGQSIGMAGFYLPPLFTGLVAVVMGLWCWVLGVREDGHDGSWPGALVAGLLTVLAPGFYLRTRLGYYDTDIVTLLFPLAIALGLVLCMRPWVKATWTQKEALPPNPETAQGTQQLLLLLGVMTLIGLFGRFGALWHGHVLTFVKVLCVVSTMWVFLVARPGARGALLLAVAVFMASALLGWLGLGISLAIIAAVYGLKSKAAVLWRKPWPGLALLVVLALLGGVAETAYDSTSAFFQAYMKGKADTIAPVETEVVYPGIGQSVIEAQNIPLDRVLGRFHASTVIAVVGVLAFLAVACMRPAALLLAPFLLMGLGAVKLGSRLTMFGSAPVALGMAMLVGWGGVLIVKRGLYAPYLRAGVALVAALLLAWPALRIYLTLPVTPVLTKEHCKALETLTTSPKDSKVWTWWDWGYATHYYAERLSFADGGRHYGHHVYTLGLAMTTPNPLLASQLIKYSAQHDDEPWKVWNTMSREEVQKMIQELGSTPMNLPLDAPRYFVATYENIRLAPWITYYGTWDMAKKDGIKGTLFQLRQSFRIDYDNGGLDFMDGQGSVPVDSITIISNEGRQSAQYPSRGGRGAHLLVQKDLRQYYILDDQLYNSMLVQLFLENPEAPRYGEQFKLIYDDFPHVRIFEVQ